MKIILLSVGTRGDMEPFLAIGELLQEKGHQVICAFPEQFRNLVINSNLDFASLGTKFIEMLESDAGKAALGGSSSGLVKFWATLKLAAKQNEINKELVRNQQAIVERENPDRIVYNGKAIYPLLCELKDRGKTILISPVPYMHYVKGHTHVAFNSNFGPLLNKLTYSLADFGLVVTGKISAKWSGLGKRVTLKELRKVLSKRKVIYTISPTLFPKPDYWDDNLQVLGFHERNTDQHWQPGKDLQDFLEQHDRILFVTFGSMTNPKPEEKTTVILDILQRNKIPAIINTASGGLVKPQEFNTGLFHFVTEIPYDWIFPKIYAVIHHGGSGTTHKSLKYGCPTMIIPHIIDQFAWNNIVCELGAGPKGIKIGNISKRNLEPKILELMSNASFKKKAGKIAEIMRKEDYRKELYQSIVT